MKNVRIKVIENCGGIWWWYSICQGRKQIWTGNGYENKSRTKRAAKAMAKRIGIKFDPEIVKQHGC